MTEQVRILILDPDDQAAAECTKALKTRGWKADRVRTFKEGEGLLAEETYDVVIIDLILPDVDGTEAWSRIRAASRETLGIITTSSPSLHNSIFAAERGILAYLQKPLKMPALCSFIAESLRYQRGAAINGTTQRQLVGLCQFLSSITQTSDQTQVLKRALAHLPAILKFDVAAVYLLNEDKSTWTRHVQHRPFPMQIEFADAQSEFIQQLVIEGIHSLQPRSFLQSDSPDHTGTRLRLQELGFSDLLLVPLVGPGEPYGALAVITGLDSDLTFAPYDVHLLTIVSQALALALDRARILEKLGAEPIHDEATGAFTPAYLDALIGIETARRKRHGQPFSLMLIDTPALGRRSMDETDEMRLSVQREVANAARSIVRRSDVVAGLPEWQVAILLPETAEPGAQLAMRRVTQGVEGRLAAESGLPVRPLQAQIVMPTEAVQSLGDMLMLAHV